MAARTSAIALVVIGLCVPPALADPALDALIAAYPDHLAGYDQKDVIWKDGTRMAISDGRTGKSFDELIGSPDIRTVRIPYPLHRDQSPRSTRILAASATSRFPRLRRCRKGEVSGRLKPVAWMPGRRGGTVSVTTVNGINQRLAEVVKELEKLPGSMTQYLVPSAGTYNCRPIANTNRLSVHAFGAAIDVNSKFADYWEWSKGKDGKIIWKNRVPAVIGDASSVTASSGAPSGITSTACISNTGGAVALARQGSWPRSRAAVCKRRGKIPECRACGRATI
jgi:hypothetical protein